MEHNNNIKLYFPEITPLQEEQFAALYDLYYDWNAKINVISRKDIENLYPHHVLHSLGIAKLIKFRPGSQIMDLGTGGGFPGIPLAILFPPILVSRQHWQEDQGGASGCRGDRLEKRRVQALPWRRSEGDFRFCGKPGGHAFRRSGKDHP